MSVILYKGNTSPAITDTITINGVAVNLTGATVRLQARLATSAPGATLIIDQAATIVAPTLGTIQYVPVAGDTATAYSNPCLSGWWHITLAGGAIQDTPEFAIYILDHAEASTVDLCTVTDVLGTMEMQPADHTRDTLISQYITDASVEICRYCDREFAPNTASATRRFHIDPATMIVEFQGYDLRTVTSITVNPEAGPFVLSSANDDYELMPLTPQSGTYKAIQISRTIPMYSTHRYRYGRAMCDVAGAWGFATVPADARRACIVTVRSWLDRSVSAWGMNDLSALGPGMTPQAEGSYGLPPSAMRTLKNYRPVLIG